MKKERGNRFKDFSNKIFGRLTVIKIDHTKRTNSGKISIKWECLCICGGKTITTGQRLSSGHTTSCGCALKEQARALKILPFGVVAKNKVLSAYKKGAKKRNLSFKLTEIQFFELTKGLCHYCGEPPMNSSSRSPQTGTYI